MNFYFLAFQFELLLKVTFLKSQELQVRIKPRRNRVEREIRGLRRSAKLIIPRAPFIRIVRDIMEDIFPRLNIRRF